MVIRPDVPWLLCSRERFDEAKMGGYPFLEARQIADKVSPVQHAGRVCLCRRFGTGNLLLRAAVQPNAVHYHLCANDSRLPGCANINAEAIDDLQEHPPKVIIFVQSSSSWLRQPNTPGDFFDFLNSGMHKNYNLLAAT